MADKFIIDFNALRKHVIGGFQCDPKSVHGPAHWQRVEKNALTIADDNGADVDVVRLFALLHDSKREDDGSDLQHGHRAALYAATLRGNFFHLSDENFDRLTYACERHTYGELSEDPTIGACWDADRLDLPRVGILPSPRFMSTLLGKALAQKLR
jgi:uncharacterized protein